MQIVTVDRSSTTDFIFPKYFVLEDGETLEVFHKVHLRREIIDLLNECAAIRIEEYGRGQAHASAKLMSKINKILDILVTEFLPTMPPSVEEMQQELRQIVLQTTSAYMSRYKDSYKDIDPEVAYWFDWQNCYNTTFSICIVRIALSCHKLPIVSSTNWKNFSPIFIPLAVVF